MSLHSLSSLVFGTLELLGKAPFRLSEDEKIIWEDIRKT